MMKNKLEKQLLEAELEEKLFSDEDTTEIIERLVKEFGWENI